MGGAQHVGASAVRRVDSPVPGKLTLWQYVQNVLFYIHIALATVAYGAWGIFIVLRRGTEGAKHVATVWLRYLIWAARFHLGLVTEVRGTSPTGDCIVASKHQCFWDILSIAYVLPDRAFIMKREVMRVPIMGWFAYKVGCIPIDRARGKDAMRAISTRINERMQRGELGQLIIYPEGTRTLPGHKKPYKHGVATIRAGTGLPVVPVAVNTGLFWPRKGWGIRPGRAVIEFLPPMPAELRSDQVIPYLEEVIESNSDRLMAEAGFKG